MKTGSTFAVLGLAGLLMLAWHQSDHWLSGSSAAETRGLDPELRQQAIAEAESLSRLHTLVVARHGELEIAHHQGGPGLDQPANIKSVSKTVLSALVGAAIDRGVLTGSDQPLTELLNNRVPPDADPRVHDITIGHLLSMQAGLERTSGANYAQWVASRDWVENALARPFVDEPGGRMLYSTGSSHLVSAALTDAAGRSTLELAQEWLGTPLNINIPPWTTDPQGIYLGGNEMRLSPLALVQFGELFRNGGVVNGEQVLSSEWIETSWTPRSNSAFTRHAYGYGWFMTEMGRYTVYYGRGFGGQMLYVIPDLEMTVVITSDPNPPSPGGMYFRQLNRLVEQTLIPAAENGEPLG